MKNIGIVSYNIHCNFTNYGSALQSWALFKIINKLGKDKFQAKLIDYCPDILKDKDPLNPFENMWDKDEESRKMCELSLPAIRVNYKKFNLFYNNKFLKTKNTYYSDNFCNVISDESIDGFVCGSDTIFCIDEFGFDDGYYANYECMRNGKSISYAASFGDAHFDENSYKILDKRLKNFRAIGLRENNMLKYVKKIVNDEVIVERVLDPTLLLNANEYEEICEPIIEKEKYILLYARRKNEKMNEFAENLAKKNNWKIIEISLQATNCQKHKMFYEAGVEEFLSLVKNAEYIVTNSFHGMIFSVKFRKQFVIFSREQCNNKIDELISLFGLKDRMLINGDEKYNENINYDIVEENIEKEKIKSLEYLKTQLNKLLDLESEEN